MNTQMHRNDPLGWIDQLREALADLEEFGAPGGQVSPEGRRAAYHVAVALGQCRVFGVQVPEDIDGTLPVADAAAAAEEAAEWVAHWTEHAGTLAGRWCHAEPEEAEALCADILEMRMDGHCVMEAVSECYERMLQEDDPATPGFERALDRLVEALRTFDAVLLRPDNLALLSTVTELPLLENWKQMLHGSHADSPPWWLDGTLEAAAEHVARVCAATLPRPETWRRIAQRARLQAAPATVKRRQPAEVIFRIPAAYAAAAATPSTTPPVRGFLRWQSPDGRLVARLSLPTTAGDADLLAIEFLAAGEEKLALELAGQPVRLAGVPARIDEAAVARFELGRLKQALGQPSAQMALEVGDPPCEWWSASEAETPGQEKDDAGSVGQ